MRFEDQCRRITALYLIPSCNSDIYRDAPRPHSNVLSAGFLFEEDSELCGNYVMMIFRLFVFLGNVRPYLRAVWLIVFLGLLCSVEN